MSDGGAAVAGAAVDCELRAPSARPAGLSLGGPRRSKPDSPRCSAPDPTAGVGMERRRPESCRFASLLAGVAGGGPRFSEAGACAGGGGGGAALRARALGVGAGAMRGAVRGGACGGPRPAGVAAELLAFARGLRICGGGSGLATALVRAAVATSRLCDAAAAGGRCGAVAR